MKRNAIILAAGKSTRFAPFTYERPKGLYEVKGEYLIKRQIKQILLQVAKFLDKLKVDFKKFYPDIYSPVPYGYEAMLREMFYENLIGNN